MRINRYYRLGLASRPFDQVPGFVKQVRNNRRIGAFPGGGRNTSQCGRQPTQAAGQRVAHESLPMFFPVNHCASASHYNAHASNPIHRFLFLATFFLLTSSFMLAFFLIT
jgi:hypothetical protein